MPPEIPETRAAAELQWTRPKSAGSWNGGAGCQFKWDSNFLGNTYTQCGTAGVIAFKARQRKSRGKAGKAGKAARATATVTQPSVTPCLVA